jgi:Predicted membrane protein
MGLKERIAAVTAWVQARKPVRVFLRYGRDRGPLFASGLAYQALFAVFAALWVGFSIAGLVVSGSAGLQGVILDFLDETIPGLIDDGDGTGAIDPEVLSQGAAFSISGVVALGGLLFTALGWLDAARSSVRRMLDLPPVTRNVFLQKGLDLAAGIAFAVLLLAAAGLSFAGSSATALLLDWLGVSRDSVLGFVAGRVVSIAVSVLVYAVALAGLYRFIAGAKVPWRFLRGGILLGAVGIAGLTILSGLLLGGASNNPLIASFAVIAGLLIYYNFVCQVLLLAASWMAVGIEDAGVVLDEEAAAARLEAARALVRENEPEPEAQRPGFFARLFRRRARVTSNE